MLTCSCCGADITMPVFVNGLPYGFVCANKIGYTGKKQSKKYVKLNVENLAIKHLENSVYSIVKADIEGVRYSGRVATLNNDGSHKDGVLSGMMVKQSGAYAEIMVYFIDGACYKKVK